MTGQQHSFPFAGKAPDSPEAMEPIKTHTNTSHSDPHFFKGACICGCSKCTANNEKGVRICIDDDCPASKCGMKAFQVKANAT